MSRFVNRGTLMRIASDSCTMRMAYSCSRSSIENEDTRPRRFTSASTRPSRWSMRTASRRAAADAELARELHLRQRFAGRRAPFRIDSRRLVRSRPRHVARFRLRVWPRAVERSAFVGTADASFRLGASSPAAVCRVSSRQPGSITSGDKAGRHERR